MNSNLHCGSLLSKKTTEDKGTDTTEVPPENEGTDDNIGLTAYKSDSIPGSSTQTTAPQVIGLPLEKRGPKYTSGV